MAQIERLNERNVFLKCLKVPNMNDMHNIMLSSPLGCFDIYILTDISLKKGYVHCLNRINEIFTYYNVPLNHRLVINSRRLAYKYFDEISSFGFEPNQ